MKKSTLVVTATIGALAIAGASAGGTLLYQQARDAREDAAAAEERNRKLEETNRELEERITELEEQSASSPLGGLEDLLGEGGMEDLEGLLGEGGLDGLLGGMGDIPGGECLNISGLGGIEDLLGEGGVDQDDLVATVSEQVAEMRELSFDHPVEAEFLTDAEIEERLRESILEEYSQEDAEIDSQLLGAIGAVPPGTDMMELTLQLYESQVAGFYDPDTGELVVRSTDSIGPADKVILAHEIEHALADQAHGLPDLEGAAFEGDDDLLLATLAVIEGDASLLMNQWALSNLGLAEQMEMAMDPRIGEAQAMLDEMPPYIASELNFPYTDGLDYQCGQWLEDGWAGVDRGYVDTPPTTAQVLFSDHPGITDTPEELSAPRGLEAAYDSTFGAAQLMWLLEAPGGDEAAGFEDARERASAWGGGQVTLWQDDTGPYIGLSLVDRGSSPDLCDTMTAWYAAAFPAADQDEAGDTVTFTGQGQDAMIACEGNSVQIGIADGVAAAGSLVD